MNRTNRPFHQEEMNVRTILAFFVLLSLVPLTSAADTCQPPENKWWLPAVCTDTSGTELTVTLSGRAQKPNRGSLHVHASNPIRIISQTGVRTSLDLSRKDELTITPESNYHVQFTVDKLALVALDLSDSITTRVVLNGRITKPDAGGFIYLHEGDISRYFKIVEPAISSSYSKDDQQSVRVMYSQDLADGTVTFSQTNGYGVSGYPVDYDNQPLYNLPVMPSYDWTVLGRTQHICHHWQLSALVYAPNDMGAVKQSKFSSGTFYVVHDVDQITRRSCEAELPPKPAVAGGEKPNHPDLIVYSNDNDEQVTIAGGVSSNYVAFTHEFEVGAVAGDILVSVDPAISLLYSIIDDSGESVPEGVSTYTLESTADQESGTYEVQEGELETFIFTITYTPPAGSVTTARSRLEGIRYHLDGTSEIRHFSFADTTDDFQTGLVIISN